MPHVFEPAPTGRAKCRGCGQPIEKGSLRFGERIANPFGEGEASLWFHPACAAYKRPEPLLETLPAAPSGLPEPERLEAIARGSMTHRRVPRVDGGERSPSSQANCRHCKEKIVKGTWRIRLVFYEEGRFNPGGFIHLDCRKDYFEGGDVREAVLHFSPTLEAADRAELEQAFR